VSSLLVHPHDISQIDAARIMKVDVEMFHRNGMISGNPYILFWGEKVMDHEQRHKNSASAVFVHFCECWLLLVVNFVQVFDGQYTATADVIVNVDDVNDNAPQFRQHFYQVTKRIDDVDDDDDDDNGNRSKNFDKRPHRRGGGFITGRQWTVTPSSLEH